MMTAVAMELALYASLMLLVSQYSGVTELLLRLTILQLLSAGRDVEVLPMAKTLASYHECSETTCTHALYNNACQQCTHTS